MKKFYAILCIVIASLTQLQAQAPQGFNYQATVRNSSGDLIVNTNVYFKFNVIQGSQTAVPIFTETHYVPTDDLGQVNLIIGQGTANTGTFSELDWSQGSYYLGIELDTGNGYLAMGTTQLLSVPYALYAENSGNSTPTTTNLETVLAENNSANNQQIKDLQDPTDAQDAVTKNYADNIISSFGYQQWSNNQVWNDNTTISPEPNSFWFINADNTTITLPPLSNQGDVIKIYYMGAGFNNTTENSNQWEGFYTNIDAQTNEVFIGYFGIIEPYDEGFHYTFNEIIPFKLARGLNTFIQIGDYWMLGEAVPLPPQYIDNDGDGYTENQGDCDDANAQVNPGATEIEDGIDNNCDGEIDEGFNELLTLPVITTNEQIEIFSAYANSGGNITSDGGAEVTERGVVWGTSPNPTINLETKTQNGGGTGNFSSYVYGLSLGVEYYLRAYATNSVGTAYGDEIVFETSYAIGSVTDQDGNTYDYITYGDQLWTVDNAEMVTYRDGTPIPEVTDNGEWENLTTGAWCYYNNDPTKPRLYNWYAVAGINDVASLSDATLRKEFAPEGWHVPSDNEWTTLEEYLIASGYNYDGTTTYNKIAKAMASNTGWNSSTNTGAIGNDQSLNNSSDFNAFPEGNRSSGGSFGNEGTSALFWSSTEVSASNSAWYRFLLLNNSSLLRSSFNKLFGFSVRFVRD